MGRLLRISIYAFFILVLYFWITAIIKSESEKENNSDDKVAVQNNALDSEFADSILTVGTTDSDSLSDDDLDGEIIDYNDIDKKVNALKGDNETANPLKTKIENTKATEPVKKINVNSDTKAKTKVSTVNTKPNIGDGGSFMVICGSYLLKENADKMVQKLKKIGYTNAKVTIFDGSGYHSAIAAQFSSQADAQKASASLKKNGIDCFVKTR